VTHCSNIIVIAGLYARKIVPRKNVAAFCSFLKVQSSFLIILYKTHCTSMEHDSELKLSERIVKTGSLAEELNAFPLIHWTSKVPIAIMHCQSTHRIWILERDSLA